MEEKYDLGEYVDRLYSAAIKRTHDNYVAEDIVQETFLAAISQLSRGKRPDNLWAWLKAILSNKYCDWLREKYSRPQISLEEYPFELEDESVPDDDSEKELEGIRRELGYLARIHREVMIRFYMHGHTVEQIAGELQIPVGTVKSRLNIGRQHVRKGVTDMENYTKQSYEPDYLHVACSGGMGLHNEPFSLVPASDRLAQSILILAYPRPVTETELAKALGVPVVFIEPVVEKLTDGELMRRTEGGKVFTDFIIYTDKDRTATFDRQLAIVEKHFAVFWKETEKGLCRLREKPWYLRQSEHAKSKLELHFCVKLLMNAHIIVRDEVTGAMGYSEYPYRKNGGRWLAMGMQYPAGERWEDSAEFRKYDVSGESGWEEQNFRNAKYLELREYGTSLGRALDFDQTSRYLKWFYELWEGIPVEDSSTEKSSTEESFAGTPVLQDADELIRRGFLKREDTLKTDIPVLSRAEYREESNLVSEYEKKAADCIRQVLLPVFESGFVRLPAHLKSVPKWQQYMFCGDSVPMAVILKAREKGLFLKGVDYPVPASLLVYEKA